MPHYAGGGADLTAIDTLAELNTNLTDATLDDAASPRTPTAHNQALATITDAGTAAAAATTDFATAAQGTLADTALQPGDALTNPLTADLDIGGNTLKTTKHLTNFAVDLGGGANYLVGDAFGAGLTTAAIGCWVYLTTGAYTLCQFSNATLDRYLRLETNNGTITVNGYDGSPKYSGLSLSGTLNEWHFVWFSTADNGSWADLVMGIDGQVVSGSINNAYSGHEATWMPVWGVSIGNGPTLIGGLALTTTTISSDLVKTIAAGAKPSEVFPIAWDSVNHDTTTASTVGSGTVTPFGTVLDSSSVPTVYSGNIAITPFGSAALALDGLTWPSADGTSGQVITTDGLGSLAFGSIDSATTTTQGIVELATDGEAIAGVAVQGNDSRLSNARTPTAHTHTMSEVTDAGTAAVLNVPASGNAAVGEVVKGNDTRLTNSLQTITYAATIAPDVSTGRNFVCLLTGNVTLNTPTNGSAGDEITLTLIQDATPGQTLTLSSGVKLGTDVASATLSTATGYTRDVFRLIKDPTGGLDWYIILVARGYV